MTTPTYDPTADAAAALRFNISTGIDRAARAKTQQANFLKQQVENLRKLATSADGKAALGDFYDSTLAQLDAILGVS